MTFSPWTRLSMDSPLPPHEVLRRLEWAIPACCRRPKWTPDKPYFCGEVDPASGWFRLRANVAAKARGVSPTLVGCLRPTAHGTVIDASISPSVPFWIGLLILCFLLSFPPIGVLAWSLSDAMKANELAAFILFPILGAMMTSWLWGTLIGLHYVYRSRYVSEFSRLMERVGECPPASRSPLTPPSSNSRRDAGR